MTWNPPAPGATSGGAPTTTGDPFSTQDLANVQILFEPGTPDTTEASTGNLALGRSLSIEGTDLNTGGKPAQVYTYEQSLKNFYHIPDGAQLEALQKQLVAAGYLSASDVHFGTHDDATFAAYQNFLQTVIREQASGIKRTPDQILSDLAAHPSPSSTNGGNGPITTYDTTATQGVANQAAQGLFGRNASDTEVADLQSHINGALQAASANNQQIDVGQLAQDYFTGLHPNAAGSQAALHYYDLIMQAVGQ